MQNFINEVREWAKLRHLDIKGQQSGFAKNVFEELAEFARSDFDEGQIDALLDIAVFSINASKDFKDDGKIRSTFNLYLEKLLIELDDFIKSDYQNCFGVLWIIKEFINHRFRYDFDICTKELMKELNSRTGAWDEKKQKWIKDKSPEAKTKWYKADYSKAIWCQLDILEI